MLGKMGELDCILAWQLPQASTSFYLCLFGPASDKVGIIPSTLCRQGVSSGGPTGCKAPDSFNYLVIAKLPCLAPLSKQGKTNKLR